MEKELNKKYYDIIVEIIKSHRKFVGCEEILEQVADDAYEHAKVIIETLTNEDVIIAYLNKVVSTSIITVPKKLNITTRKTTCIENIIKERKTTLTSNVNFSEKEEEDGVLYNNNYGFEHLPEDNFDSELEIENKKTEDFNTELDSTESFLEEELLTSNYNNTASEEAEDTEEAEEAEKIEKNNSISSLDTRETVQEESDNIDDNTFDSLPLEKQNTETIEDKVDKTLVDKMINGVRADLDLEEEEEEEIFDSIVDDTLETNFVNDSLVLYTEEDNKITENLSDDILENNSTESFTQQHDTSQVDEIEIEEDLFQEINDLEPLVDFSIDIADKPVNGVEEFQDIENKESIEQICESYCPIIYKKFCYEHKHQEPMFKDEICSSLIEISEKLPELKILEVCDLKYNKRLSISQISSELNMETNAILEALNEITNIVKD